MVADPGSLGLLVAGLVAGLMAKKALESAGDRAGEAGWELVGRVSSRVRGWSSDTSAGKPGVYHAAQATIIPRAPLAASIAAMAERVGS